MTSTNTQDKIRKLRACLTTAGVLASVILLGATSGVLMMLATMQAASSFMLLAFPALFLFTRIFVVAYQLDPAVRKNGGRS